MKRKREYRRQRPQERKKPQRGDRRQRHERRERRENGPTERCRLVGGKPHGRIVEIEAGANETLVISQPSGWAFLYKRNPENNSEFLLQRTAHITEWHMPDYQLERTSSDDCCKCGKPQLATGGEVCIRPCRDRPDEEICFRICRPCLREMDFEQYEALCEQLQTRAIEMVKQQVAAAN